MNMSTFGPLKSDSTELQTSIAKALEDLALPPKLAILFPSHKVAISSVISTIKNISDVPIVGATTGGAGFTEKGIALDGIVGAFIGGENLNIQIAQITDLKSNLENNIAEALKQIQPASTSGHSLFVLADAMACDGEKLSQTLAAQVPIHWRIFGGFAGDGWAFSKTKVIYNQEVFSDGGVLVYINDGSVPSIGVRHGFLGIDDQTDLRITKIEGNILQEIEGRPALQVYKEILSAQGLLQEGSDIVPLLASYPIGIKTLSNEQWKIRSPLGIDGDSLVLAGSIPPTNFIRVMVGQENNLLSAAKEVIQQAKTGLKGNKPNAQIMIDCAVRQQILKTDYMEQVKSFRISPNSPMLGFSSYGEFARLGGSLEGFHNATAVAVLW